VVFGLLLAVTLATHSDDNWRKLNTNGVGPGKRDAMVVTDFDGEIFHFGGIDESLDPTNLQPNVFFNDIFVFRVAGKRWVKKNPHPDPVHGFPTPRAFSIGGRNDREFVVGFGISYNSDFSNIVTFNDLWSYNTRTNTWKMLRPNNDVHGPIPRGEPVGGVFNGNVYLFGGVTDQFSSLGDFWIYDISSNVWTQHTPAVLPSARHGADFTLDQDNGRLWVYAGERCSFTDEGLSCVFAGPDAHWYLDLDTNNWVQIHALLTVPNRSSQRRRVRRRQVHDLRRRPRGRQGVPQLHHPAEQRQRDLVLQHQHQHMEPALPAHPSAQP